MKIVLCIILSLVMLLSMSVTAFASETTDNEISIEIDPETTITIVVPDELIGEIGAEEIDGLIGSQNFNNGDVITIHEVQEATVDENIAQPYILGRVETTLSWGSEYKAQDYFVISAAKGQTTTLSAKFSKTLTTNFSVGDDAYAKAEIGGSVTAEYSVTHEFVGPPESSNYNSREFRVQFYAKPVTWVQIKYNWLGNYVGTRTGTAYVPTKYLLYSIDHTV